MEISSMKGLSELGTEDCSFLNQWNMNSIDEFNILPSAAMSGDTLQQCHSFPNFGFKSSLNIPHSIIDRPQKQLKPNTWINNPLQTGLFANNVSVMSSNHMNQMGVLKPKEEEAFCSKSMSMAASDILASQGFGGNQNYLFKAACKGTKRISPAGNGLSQTQDHIIAERKRREKLSQRFIALSAIVPGLKKMDKASVLGDAIKYLKQLQEKVKTLEEQTKKKSVESVVFVRKSHLYAEGENTSSEENSSSNSFNEPLPEIEARFCEKNVLIRVHCEKRKGVFEKTVAEIEKLHLTVINSSVMAFGASALDLTVIAQMDAEFSLSVRDVVKILHSSFQEFMSSSPLL